MIAAPTMAELLRSPPKDNSSYVECVRQLRAAAIRAEQVLGGPVVIAGTWTTATDNSYVVKYTFIRAPRTPEAPDPVSM